MATVILYPVADVSLQHAKYPTSSSNGYSLINDASGSPDNASSYIQVSMSDSGTSSVTSVFKVNDTTVNRKIYLTGLRASIRQTNGSSSTTGTTTPSISINGGTERTGTTVQSTSTSWNTSAVTFSNVSGLNQEYDSFTAADIRLKLATTANVSNKNGSSVRITQAYVTATYDPIWNCTASNAEGCDSVSCSAAEVRDGNSCTFTATYSGGKVFVGWFSDFECTQLVSTSATYVINAVSGDTTLYAKASLVYTVNVYNDEYCSVIASPTTGYYGTSVTVTCTPSDNMKEFVGWYSNPSRTNLVSDANPYTFSLANDTNLYAKCKPKYIIYIKINSVWETCSQAYKKVNGAWVAQDDLSTLFETNKNYLKVEV